MAHWPDDKLQQLIELWPKHSQSQLAGILGMSTSAISAQVSRLRANGVEMVRRGHTGGGRRKGGTVVLPPVVEIHPMSAQRRDGGALRFAKYG